MKKLIIINSTLGCGKSTVSRKVAAKLSNTKVIHGDDISKDVEGFSVYHESSLKKVIKLIAIKINSSFNEDVDYVVLDYVFEDPSQKQLLLKKINPEIEVNTFYLKAYSNIIEQRIIKRGRVNIQWELKRSLEISQKQSAFIESMS